MPKAETLRTPKIVRVAHTGSLTVCTRGWGGPHTVWGSVKHKSKGTTPEGPLHFKRKPSFPPLPPEQALVGLGRTFDAGGGRKKEDLRPLKKNPKKNASCNRKLTGWFFSAFSPHWKGIGRRMTSPVWAVKQDLMLWFLILPQAPFLLPNSHSQQGVIKQTVKSELEKTLSDVPGTPNA